MNKNNSIGIFDSGVGGLSVLQSINTLMPHENLVYVADSAHVPYGNKSAGYIQQRSVTLTQFLLEQHHAKAIVVACNTATAAAVSLLREKFSLPIVGMEPAVKPAAAASKNKIIGVLATEGTLKSAQFAALLERFARDITVFTQPCHGLVEKVEQGLVHDSATRELIGKYMQPLLAQGVDTIILGCTHYPFLRQLIADIAGKNIVLIDTGDAVARRVQQVLRERSLLNNRNGIGTSTFYTSGNLAEARRVIPLLSGQATEVKMLPQIFA
ncbi:MAG: glutamate racemase [Burkholderiales bacterium]